MESINQKAQEASYNGLAQHTSHFVNGFGFHSGENDYKVVRLIRVLLPHENVVLEVEVYSLRSDAWRRITVMPYFSNTVISWQSRCTFFDGVVYWIITEHSHTSILAFDLGSEVFRKIVLPPEFIGHICIRVFEKSLSLFHTRPGHAYGFCKRMLNWKVIRTICLPDGTRFVAWPLGIRKNLGKVHMIQDGRKPKLVLYDPESHQVKDTGIRTESSYFHDVDAYCQSLFLLDW